MIKKDKDYYGIKFNNDVPKLDKINEYNKEVEVKFIGQAFLVERKKDKIEKTPLKNYYKIEKEGTYEIEFINNKNEIYNLQVRVKKSCLFFILLFMIGILIFTAITPFKNNESIFQRFLSIIDISVVEVEIEEDEPMKYVFDVNFKNLVSSEIKLPSTLDAKSVLQNKLAPGVNGEFSIIISTQNSSVDMRYSIDFQDITNEKPKNLIFKIKGSAEEYRSLQELEKDLKGIIKKESEKEFVIEWLWPYEIDYSQDIVDTNDGTILNNYKFIINVNGEEVL